MIQIEIEIEVEEATPFILILKNPCSSAGISPKNALPL